MKEIDCNNTESIKNVLITGAGSGLGYTTTQLLAEKGWRVFALDIHLFELERPKHASIIPIKVDVSNDESVAEAIKQVENYTHTLDAIVNFAGILVIGPSMETPPDLMLRIMNINLVGTYRINYYCFPLIQKGKGRIVNISSEAGIFSPPPFANFYYTSKHAIESYTDALRRELRFLGIKVITVRPGAFQTNMQGGAKNKFDEIEKNSQLFEKQIAKGNAMFELGAGKPRNPYVLAKKIHYILETKHPKSVYNIYINKLFRLLNILPKRCQDMIYYRMLK